RKKLGNMMPYAVEVVSIDHPGIVHDIAQFFSTRDINIEEMYTGSYSAAHTGTPMFSLHVTISVPTNTSIAALRGEFMDFCDQLNLDAVMEPVK
ncbi:MAG: glycine cleavage system protein R, partial [Gammaproteobacteria bacterium]